MSTIQEKRPLANLEAGFLAGLHRLLIDRAWLDSRSGRSLPAASAIYGPDQVCIANSRLRTHATIYDAMHLSGMLDAGTATGARAVVTGGKRIDRARVKEGRDRILTHVDGCDEVRPSRDSQVTAYADSSEENPRQPDLARGLR